MVMRKRLNIHWAQQQMPTTVKIHIKNVRLEEFLSVK